MKLKIAFCLLALSFASFASASGISELLRLALYYPARPRCVRFLLTSISNSIENFLLSYESFGSIGHWRCGDWRSRYRIINCDDPFHPVVDYPLGYDPSNDGWGHFRSRVFGIAVSGYPALYKESDT